MPVVGIHPVVGILVCTMVYIVISALFFCSDVGPHGVSKNSLILSKRIMGFKENVVFCKLT